MEIDELYQKIKERCGGDPVKEGIFLNFLLDAMVKEDFKKPKTNRKLVILIALGVSAIILMITGVFIDNLGREVFTTGYYITIAGVLVGILFLVAISLTVLKEKSTKKEHKMSRATLKNIKLASSFKWLLLRTGK